MLQNYYYIDYYEGKKLKWVHKAWLWTFSNIFGVWNVIAILKWKKCINFCSKFESSNYLLCGLSLCNFTRVGKMFRFDEKNKKKINKYIWKKKKVISPIIFNLKITSVQVKPFPLQYAMHASWPVQLKGGSSPCFPSSPIKVRN